MPQSYNIDPQTWGTEDEWFDWNKEPWTYPYTPSSYSNAFSEAFKAADFKSPYYYKSNFGDDGVNETYRVQWRGLFIKDYYFGSPPPDSVADLPIKADKAIETKQWPTPWGFGIDSPMSNIYTVLPRYSSSGYASGNVWPEVDTDYFYTNFANKFGKNLYKFSASDDWGMEVDTSRTGKPMPFVPVFGGSSSPTDAIQYSRKDFKGTSSFNSVYTTYPNYVPLSFNYQKIVVVPKVYCAKYDDTKDYGLNFAGPYTISQYFDGVNWNPDTQTGTPPAKDTYPMITSVGISWIYFGTTDGTSANKRTYLSGANFGAFLPDTLTLGGVPSTRILKNGSYYLYHSHWGANDNADSWHPANGYVIDTGVISGMNQVYNNVFEFYMTLNTELTDLRKSYINYTQDETTVLPLFHQNGDYEIHCVQRHSNGGTIPQNTMGICALWKNPTKEKVMRDVAYLGFWFADDWQTAERAFTGEDCNDPKMHIPLFDEDGLTTGEWLSGPDAANADNARWQDPFQDNDYNPEHVTPPSGDEKDFGDLDNKDFRGLVFHNMSMYALSESELLQFLTTVNAMYINDTDTQQMQLDFKGSNPMEYITALYGYPFDIPYVGTPTTIKIGPVDTGVAANRVEAQSWGALAFGSVSIDPYYYDFRDYEPYTTIDLYLPLCGTVRLDPALYIGHTLYIEYDFDPATGNLMAKVCRDDMIDKVVEGSVCVQIPVVSSDMGSYQAAIHQIKSRILQTVFGTIQTLSPSSGIKSAAASGNQAGVLAAIPDPFKITMDTALDAYNINYDLKHTQPHQSVTGTSDPLNALNMDNHAFVFIKRAKMLPGYNAQQYSHTIGNACLRQGKIKDFAGYTQCSSVDLSGISATSYEISKLRGLLQSGIYL